MSLYEEIGGDAAVDKALNVFYPKVMEDPRLGVFFEGVDVEAVKRKQKAFLIMAFGGPDRYDGRALRAAHRRAVEQGLNDTTYEVFMGHFRSTLQELGVAEEKITEILAVADGGREEVLNR